MGEFNGLCDCVLESCLENPLLVPTAIDEMHNVLAILRAGGKSSNRSQPEALLPTAFADGPFQRPVRASTAAATARLWLKPTGKQGSKHKRPADGEGAQTNGGGANVAKRARA